MKIVYYLHVTFMVKKCPKGRLAPEHLHIIKSGPLWKKFGHPCCKELHWLVHQYRVWIWPVCDPILIQQSIHLSVSVSLHAQHQRTDLLVDLCRHHLLSTLSSTYTPWQSGSFSRSSYIVCHKQGIFVIHAQFHILCNKTCYSCLACLLCLRFISVFFIACLLLSHCIYVLAVKMCYCVGMSQGSHRLYATVFNPDNW